MDGHCHLAEILFFFCTKLSELGTQNTQVACAALSILIATKVCLVCNISVASTRVGVPAWRVMGTEGKSNPHMWALHVYVRMCFLCCICLHCISVHQFASMTYNDGKHPKQCRVHMAGIEEEIGPKVDIEQITKDETRARAQKETKDPDPACG